MTIPKALEDSFEFVRGTKITVIVGDEGIFIPLKSKIKRRDIPPEMKEV